MSSTYLKYLKYRYKSNKFSKIRLIMPKFWNSRRLKLAYKIIWHRRCLLIGKRTVVSIHLLFSTRHMYQRGTSQQTFVSMKTSWRRLEDVFHLRLQKTRLGHTSSRRLQDVFKTSSRRLQDVFKTSSRRLQSAFRTSSIHLQNVLKTSSRRFQDVSSS